MAAYTAIDNPELYFQVKTYSGTGSQLAVTLDGNTDMQPDFVWFKNRGTTNSQGLQDSVRGFDTTGIQSTNGTDADPAFDGSTLGYVSAVGSDGFTVEAGNCANASSNNYVAWCWKAGGGSGSSNTDGSITSTVSANTTAGFSIVKYTGTGANATVGHGLGATPKMIIFKNLDTTRNWGVLHHKLSGSGLYNLLLNSTNAEANYPSEMFNSTSPTNSVFSVGTSNDTNESGDNIIAYCFAEKTGYIKFGSYTGNGNADGAFIYTGFKPAMIIFKQTNTSGGHWYIYDNKRGQNELDDHLYPNLSSAEATGDNAIDILSNGFKCRSNNGDTNASGGTYIYMAFAEAPFVNSNGVPCNAR